MSFHTIPIRSIVAQEGKQNLLQWAGGSLNKKLEQLWLVLTDLTICACYLFRSDLLIQAPSGLYNLVGMDPAHYKRECKKRMQIVL